MSSALSIIEAESLPSLVRSAAQKLAAAETSAEVLDARHMASAAYDAAKSTARIAKAKGAYEEVISAVYHAQADALAIESAAKRRLADEYDAAQERGEVQSRGGDQSSKAELPTTAHLGISRKDIYEARLIRDAEQSDPGITRRTLHRLIEAGEEPTKAALKREIIARPEPRVADDSLWLWGRLRDFEGKGIVKQPTAALLQGMTSPMRADVNRLTPLVREFLEDLEIACDAA